MNTPPKLPASLQTNPRLSRWLDFPGQGRVTIRPGKVEIGQGILTALSQIAADELDVALSRIEVQPVATPDSPDEGVTSGSLSVQNSGAALRHVCAEARGLSDVAGRRVCPDFRRETARHPLRWRYPRRHPFCARRAESGRRGQSWG
jgi:CO/xanthine dehydrogenase Mo-binding subunit